MRCGTHQPGEEPASAPASGREKAEALLLGHAIDAHEQTNAPIIPITPNAKSPPLISGWQKPGAGADTRDAIEAMCDRWPSANVGIVTGRPLRDPARVLLVVDVDVREDKDGMSALREAEAQLGKLPSTMRVQTPTGGMHLYFAVPRPISGRIGILDGVDLRCDNNYVLAAGSVRPEGEYIATLTGGIAELPEIWFDFFETARPRPASSNEPSHVAEGGRNDALYREATLHFRLLRSEQDVLDAVTAYNRNHCHPPLREHEVRKLVTSVFRNQRRSRADGYLRHSVLWAAASFAEVQERHARWVTQWETWIVREPDRWMRDDELRIQLLVQEFATSLFASMPTLLRSQQETLIKLVAKIMQGGGSYRDLERNARPHLVTANTELDADPWLLNLRSGTCELRSGTIREHRAGDYITLVASGDPRDASAAATRIWEEFLAVAIPSEEVRSHVQKLVGLSLVGRAVEDTVVFVYGPQASGKTSFTDAVRNALGDYGAAAGFKSFLKSKADAASARSDLARLEGKRFAVASEVEEGEKLASALLKQLSGGDRVAARRLYRDEYEFVWSATIWLVANHRPRVSAEDAALWRRIHVVPFEQTVPEDERDPQLRERLCEPDVAGAIVAWALAGLATYLADGLVRPAAIEKATAEYRRSQNPVVDFLDESCELAPDAWTPIEDLYQAYVLWSQRQRRESLGKRAFGSALEGLGHPAEKRPGGTRGRPGIRLDGASEVF